MNTLAKNIALITSGASGIGRATAVLFAMKALQLPSIRRPTHHFKVT